mgnify:CR=1 FL=1
MDNPISKKILSPVLICLQLFIFFVMILLFYIFNLSLETLEAILFFVFFQCALISFYDKFFNFYQIFLFFIFLFNIAIPVFSFFDIYSFPPGNRIMLSDGIEQIVSDESLILTYQVLISMTLGSSVGWLTGIYFFGHKKLTEFFPLSPLSNIHFPMKLIFILLLISMTFRGIYLLFSVKSFGYVNVMHLGGGDSVIFQFFKMIDLLFKVTSCVILYQCRSKIEYIKYSSLVMIPFVLQAATGARGESIFVFIVLIFIYSKFFNNLKIKVVFPSFLLLFIIAVMVGSTRFGGSLTDSFSDISFLELIINKITSTSGSIGVIAYTIEIKDDFFNSIPFLFGYAEGVFSFVKNYSYAGIQDKNYLAQHLIFILEPEKLYRGSTIGTAMGAEFYEFSEGSMTIIFILTAIMIFLATYLINKMYKNVILFYIGFLYLENLFMAPRGSIMKIFNKESVLSILILIFIVGLVKLMSRPKKINY